MKPTTLLMFATMVAACANFTPPTAAEQEQIAAARALLDSSPDRAADAAEQLLREKPDLREARLLLGESSKRMAELSGFGNPQYHLEDARRYLTDALDDTEATDFPRHWRLLAEVHYQLGNFEDGAAAAARAAEGFAATPGQQNKVEYSFARLVGARCNMQRFIAERRPERENGDQDRNGIVPPGADSLALASTAAGGFAEARIDHPGEATCKLAEIHMWLDQSSEVVREYERGLLAHPEATAIHEAYMQWMTSNGQQDALTAAYRRFVRERGDAPVLRWYHARAIYVRADGLRSEGNFQGAVAIYDKARQTFAEYLALMPQHRANTQQMQALCDLSMASCCATIGELEQAQEFLLRAADTSPQTTEYRDGQPMLVDTYGKHFETVAFDVHVALSQQPDDALAATLAFNEELLRRFPDRWGWVYNNAALAARDYGVLLAKNGDQARAKELWERSYAHYEKAVELQPDDARTVNDCGLMLIYHLDRDLDRARALFDRAIELGTEQLAEMDADTPVTERERLEEAVGDAWQNIAVLLREHRNAPFADYKPFCEQAVKYYPYQRREAAQMLRTEGKQALDSTARAALANRLANAMAEQGGAKDALDASMPAIQQKLDDGDFDGALTLLDKLGAKCKAYAPYYFLKGRTTWQLANQARDSGRKGTEFFYQDAVNALTKAVELDAEPIEPRRMLGQAQYDAGDLEAATATATSLLLHMQSQGGGTAEEQVAVHELRANAAARLYIQKKNDSEDDNDLLTAARASLRLLEEKGRLTAETTKLWADTEQWAGAPAQAVAVYLRASERTPEDLGALDQVVNVAATTKQLPMAIESLQTRSDAGTQWYLGKAQFLQAGQLRMQGKLDEAVAMVEASQASFGRSMLKNAGYKDSCESWIAMCLGKLGNIAVGQKRLDDAEDLLLRSMRMRPDRIHEDLGLNETTKRGLLMLVDAYYRKNDLQKVESISRAAWAACPDDVDLANNAGLFARDYGNQLERDGAKAKAQEMYEQSYRAYSHAVRLDPQNVRLRNDKALIAIYHVERDWEETKAMLEQAIADGDAKLRDDPPADETSRQQLEEAVGDCYENLALWHLKHGKDGAAAREAAKRSQGYYPGDRRPGARRHLQAAERLLQGK